MEHTAPDIFDIPLDRLLCAYVVDYSKVPEVMQCHVPEFQVRILRGIRVQLSDDSTCLKYSSYRSYCYLWECSAPGPPGWASLHNLGDMASSLAPVGQGRLEE